MSRKLIYIHLSDKQWITSLGFIILLLLNSGCFPCSHRNNNEKKNVIAFPSLWYFKTPIWWHKCCLTRTPSYFFIYYMSMNVSINILFIVHPQHNVPQLLGRKFFRQFFHLPLTGLIKYTLFYHSFLNLVYDSLWYRSLEHSVHEQASFNNWCDIKWRKV